MRSKRRVSFLLLLVSLTFILTGCAYKSVDKRSFIVSVGVDPGEDDSHQYKVTLKIAKPIPTLSQAEGTDYAYLTTEADSVSEAIRFLETHNDKVLDFSQAKILAINKDLLGENLQEFMDYFTRRGDIQLIMYVAAAEPSAEDVLKVEPKLQSAGENSLYNFFDQTGTESPFVTTCFLFEFRRDFMTFGKDAVLPIIRSSKNEDNLIINTAIVIKEKQTPVEMSSTQTKIFNTLMKDARGYGYRAENNGYEFTLSFDRTKMDYKILTEPGVAPRAEISIKTVGSINQSNKPLSLDHLDTYNKVASDELTNELKKLLKKLQKEGVDPFGFGLRYRATRFHTEDMESDWKAIYPDLVFDVKFKVKLKSLGAIK